MSASGLSLRALVQVAREEKVAKARLQKSGEVSNGLPLALDWVPPRLSTLATADGGRGMGSECCERVRKPRK